MPAKFPVVNSGGHPGGDGLQRCNLIRRAFCGAWPRRGGRHRGRQAGAGRRHEVLACDADPEVVDAIRAAAEELFRV
jgi:hypothetical protein